MAISFKGIANVFRLLIDPNAYIVSLSRHVDKDEEIVYIYILFVTCYYINYKSKLCTNFIMEKFLSFDSIRSYLRKSQRESKTFRIAKFKM